MAPLGRGVTSVVRTHGLGVEVVARRAVVQERRGGEAEQLAASRGPRTPAPPRRRERERGVAGEQRPAAGLGRVDHEVERGRAAAGVVRRAPRDDEGLVREPGKSIGGGPTGSGGARRAEELGGVRARKVDQGVGPHAAIRLRLRRRFPAGREREGQLEVPSPGSVLTGPRRTSDSK